MSLRRLVALVVVATAPAILPCSVQAQQAVSQDVVLGTGPVARSGSRLTVHYVGALASGKVFDQSTDRSPFSFTLGSGSVIKGWDLGLHGMRAGGIRKLTIPSSMAYGERGAGGMIPPNSELTFQVFLVSVDGVAGGQLVDPSMPSPLKTPRAPRLSETLSDTPFYW